MYMIPPSDRHAERVWERGTAVSTDDMVGTIMKSIDSTERAAAIESTQRLQSKSYFGQQEWWDDVSKRLPKCHGFTKRLVGAQEAPEEVA